MSTEIRLHIERREPFAGGMSFGDVGPYERIDGSASFALDPDEAANAGIADLQHAPRSAGGRVEFTAQIALLVPADSARGNGRLLYDVINRGHKMVLGHMNDAPQSNDPMTEAHGGNGFLMRRGYSVLWSSWQGDILPVDGRMTFDVPVAEGSGGEISGPVRSEFIADEPGIHVFPLSGNDFTASYIADSLDAASATLTRRRRERDQREPVPAGEWQFARLDDDGEVTPSAEHCYLRDGFEPGWIYELVYQASRPRLLGLGFAGVRDLVSFFRRQVADTAGAQNPLLASGATIEHAYAWGSSQSGRFLREFTYRGFNDDGAARRVFDGVIAFVSGAGRVALNQRFAQPGRWPRQHEDHLYPSDRFPFAYAVTTDPLTGETDGILKRPETDPLVIHTQSAAEYWNRRGSLVHTDAAGNDLEEHQRARVYLYASTQHGAGPNRTPAEGGHKHLSNAVSGTPLSRALLDALDGWVTNGTPPPASRVPSRSAETAVRAAAVHARFPTIAGVDCPPQSNRLFVTDRGPDFDEQGVPSVEPPVEDETREYAVLVPQIDDDGNDVPGIRTPDVAVPLGTLTGWNAYRDFDGEPELYAAIGSTLPFARTPEDRAAGDPRPSLAERYRSRDAYVDAVQTAARDLISERLLLEEDAARYVERAKAEPSLD